MLMKGMMKGVTTMKRRRATLLGRPPPLGAAPPLLYKPLPLLYVRHFLILSSLA
jgi:hypothetical protein